MVLPILLEQLTGRNPELAYAGDLEPAEAWALVQEQAGVRLLDIRSQAEWDLVGRIPDAIEVEYKTYPGWQVNMNFIAEVRTKAEGAEALLVLCRSGVRSREAAEILSQAGFKHVFNVLEGFEGDRDARGRRVLRGWKARSLPWYQS